MTACHISWPIAGIAKIVSKITETAIMPGTERPIMWRSAARRCAARQITGSGTPFARAVRT
jgi:hypothetical protein